MSKNDLLDILNDTLTAIKHLRSADPLAADGYLSGSERKLQRAVNDIERDIELRDPQSTDHDDDFREATGQLETFSSTLGRNDAGEWIGRM